MTLFGKFHQAQTPPELPRYFAAAAPAAPWSRRHVPLSGFEQLRSAPFGLSLVASVVAHVGIPAVLALLWLLLSLLLAVLFNIRLSFPQPPTPQLAQTPSLEFVLVEDRQQAAPEKARFQGEFNQLAGGKKQDRPAPFETPRASSRAASQSAMAMAAVAQERPAPPEPEPARQPPEPKKTPQEKPPGHLPRPRQTAETAPESPSPTPSPPIPATASPASSTALASAGLPGLVPNLNRGAAEGGDEKTGVSVQATDFGPYMAEIKRRLSRNWHPPRHLKTRKVVLRFEVNRDGSLRHVAIEESSGEPGSDRAALEAVRTSAPFRPLPPTFGQESVPILFTFDYTVYGTSH